MLHTLKGNSAIFGLRSLSALCHELETQVIEEGAASASSMRALRDRWAAVSQSIDRWLGARPRVIELESEHHAALEHAVLSAPRATVLSMVQALKLEPTARRLGHFAEQARRIAARLGKEVDVEVDGRGLRVDSKQWAGFWSAFIHAVRNAVDHGIEPAAVRRAAGKPERGAIALGTYLRGDSFVVEISDDGAGIDWSKLAEKARALGMRAETAEELREALFRDGVSTAASVTDISGRGLGMGALREAAEALGGRVEVESKRGRGSTLRMVFPRSAMSVASRVPTSFGAPENGAVQEQVQ
jgi:two-component system chemotaxis sensor kinase CheA